MKKIGLVLTIVGSVAMAVNSCCHKKRNGGVDTADFPEEIGKIMITKCATSGCHNEASYHNAAGLRLDTWAHLFEGGSSGAVVVPYSAAYSSLLYFVNTDSAKGTVATPTMPYNQPALTAEEYDMLYGWITAGAPDKNGHIAFEGEADTRQKIYITQQGCDQVAVIDAATGLVMRYITVGVNSGSIESAHCLRVADSGNYAFVSFTGGSAMQKIDTRTDAVVGAADLNRIKIGASWNIVYPSPAGDKAITTDFSGDGLMAMVDATSMQTLPAKTLTGLVVPHAIMANAKFDTFIVAQQYGNSLVKLSYNGPYKKTFSVDGRTPYSGIASTGTGADPHELLMLPGGTRYAVTCQNSNEVRIMDARADTVLQVIPTGLFPQEMALATAQHYLLVSCMRATNSMPGRLGTIMVINYETGAVVKTINGDFYEPHGIGVDNRSGRLFIASANADINGPAAHHATACYGKAGWYSIYDLNTLQPVNDNRYMMAVKPYSAAARFKY